MKNKGAICGGNKEKAWAYIKEAKTDKEFIDRIDECFMAIMGD